MNKVMYIKIILIFNITYKNIAVNLLHYNLKNIYINGYIMIYNYC